MTKIKKNQSQSHKEFAFINLNQFEEEMCACGKYLFEFYKNKDAINQKLRENIDIVEEYFKKYDSLQLLGSIGLYLLNNLPNSEKYFMAELLDGSMNLDDNAEVIAEYALNFALSMPNNGKEIPTDAVVQDLRNRLKTLFLIYLNLDMPLTNDAATQVIDWMIHMNTISIRGDGYQKHVYEIFNEMFSPHSAFYENQYGYSVQQLFDFFMDLENRVVCKIASQESIYGSIKLYERWRKWEEENFGNDYSFSSRDFSKGLFGDFFEANPDIPHSEDGMQFRIYSPDDYLNSNMIFWIYPQNEVEGKILESLSMKFGDNMAFLAEGEFKGNIMNGSSIFEKPFIKDGDKYYCFTPMIPHRNLFLIAEKLMKHNNNYYKKNFQQNTNPISRDKYIEGKVKSIMEGFLPNVEFHSSVHYSIVDGGIRKNTELDVLGVSDKAIYIIEVKAHELSYKDRVRLDGAKHKFSESIVKACRQCCRAADFINGSVNSKFGSSNGEILIDKTKPIYKIAVTFQHYSLILGQMDNLVKAGLMEERYRDTWIVSLFDLMVVSDFMKSEDEFINYLNMRKIINTNHSVFYDELDLLAFFLNYDWANKIKCNEPIILYGGANEIDEKYTLL